MTDERTFGQRLRATRIKAGYSQSDLEEISGIPKARLSRYENGHVAPSIQTLERLARALNVSEASLLGDDRALMEEFFYVLTTRGVRIGSSEQAVALGLATRVVDDGELPAATAELAGQLAEGPALALAATKVLLGRELDLPLAGALELEAVTQALLLRSDDHAEFFAAFTEGRSPTWTGR